MFYSFSQNSKILKTFISMLYFTKVNRYLITLLSHYWIITQFMFLNLQTKNEKSNEFLNKHRGSKCILKESKWHFKTEESKWIFFLMECPGYGSRLMPTQDPSTFFFFSWFKYIVLMDATVEIFHFFKKHSGFLLDRLRDTLDICVFRDTVHVIPTNWTSLLIV